MPILSLIWSNPLASWASQSTFFALGVFATTLWLIAQRHQRNLALMLYVAILGLGAIFARALWCVLTLLHQGTWPLQWWHPIKGGYASMGWMIAAIFILGGYYQRRRRVDLFDIMVPAGVVGLALARLGCLVRGCDFGRLAQHAPLMVEYHQQGVAWHLFYSLNPMRAQTPTLHPFALYMSIWSIVVVVCVCFFVRPGDGKRAWWVAFGYLFGRLWIEHWRHPMLSPSVFYLTIHQLFALTGLVFLFAVVYWRTRSKHIEEYNAQTIDDDV